MRFVASRHRLAHPRASLCGDMSNAEVPIESLLAHRAWVRDLARKLVHDENRADDLEQQAWLAAMERPPARMDSPRGWLATVLRRAAGKERRSDFRRDVRERVVARSESLPAESDLAAHAESLERMVRAVLDLEEPYRSGILLRYFEGLGPGEISRRTRTPVETVRSRLRRALERLRDRFDQEHGGERRAWVALLLPIATSRGAGEGSAPRGAGTAVASGALVMSTKPVFATAAIAVALLAGWLLLHRPPSPGDQGMVAGARDAVSSAKDSSSAIHPETASRGDPSVARGSPAPFLPGQAELHAGCRVRLRLVEGDSRVVPPEEARRVLSEGTRVFLVRSSAFTLRGLDAYLTTAMGLREDWRTPLEIAFDDTGPYLDPPVREGPWRVFLATPGRPPILGDDASVPSSGEFEVDVRLPSATRTLRLRAVEPDSRAPLIGARVTPYFEFGDDQCFLPGVPLQTDEYGEVDLPLAAEESLQRPPSWWIESPGRAAPVVDTRAPDRRRDTLEVAVPATARIEGQAFLPSGIPAAGCTVIGGRKGYSIRTKVGEEGRFVLDAVPAAAPYMNWGLFLVETESPLKVSSSQVPVSPGKIAEVHFGERYGAGTRAVLVGRVTAGGKPMAGISILVSAAKVKRDGPSRMGTTDAEGRFRVEGIPEGETSVFVWTGGLGDDWGVRSSTPIRFAAGEQMSADFDLPGGALRVRVLDLTTGKPVKGASAGAWPAGRSAERDRFPGWSFSPGQAAYAGEDGTVLLVGLPPGVPHRLDVMARGYKSMPADESGALPGVGDPVPEVVVRLEPLPR